MARNDSTKKDGIEAVNKSHRVLTLLKEFDGAGVTELSERLDWPKSTVHSHLRTLENNEFIVREDDKYVIGFRFLDFGEYVRRRNPAFSLIEPKIEALAEDTGERVQFAVSEHGNIVYVQIAEGEHAVSTGSRLGLRRMVLHATAAGKSILASLPEEEVYEVIEQKGLSKWTPNTITEEEELFDALAEVRDRKYAFNHEEHIEGLRAVAAPVKDPTGNVIGSISISGPAHRLRGERFTEELPDKILGVCNEVELDIMYR